MKNAIILLLAIALASCNKHALPRQIPVLSTELVHERLVAVPVPADSALLTALFACDSLNNVYLLQISDQMGKSIEGHVNFENNRLIYKTIYRHDTIHVPVTDTIRKEGVPYLVEVPVEVNRLKWWQEALVWAGSVLMFFVAYWIINFLAKLKNGSR